MRVYKFRYWDDNNKEMHSTENPCIQGDNPVMQYTGLKDKNGIEIYEGDILSGKKLTYKVTWDELWGWRAWYDDQSNAGNDGALWIITDYSEVIGNIYENPELLKGA